MSTTEAVDWDLARAGDGSAFARIFDCHKNRVYAHAVRLAATQQDAEDLTAAAFLELWRRRVDVRVVEGSVIAWLLVTTTHLALNHRRGLKRHREFIARLPRGEQMGESAEASAISSASLDIDPQLLLQIRSMRQQDQALVVLIALEDLSFDAAAKALGISESAARSRWQRVKKQLSSAPSIQEVR